MKATVASLLVSLWMVGPSAIAAQVGATAPPSAPTDSQSPSYTRQSGIIEDVISGSDGVYQSTAYVVRWNGARVLVDDPLDAHDKVVGDSLDYLVTRNSIPDGHHLLAFISLEPKAAPRTSDAKPTGNNSTATTTGVVEDVLRAQDANYRFIAYIVKIGDERVAVWDTLTQSHYAIGEAIPVLELRTASPTGSLLHFQINPERPPQAAALEAQATAATLDTGVVEQVLSAGSQGYISRAYVVGWHGSDVLVQDPTTGSDYQVGDSIEFRVLRSSLADASHTGIIRLLLPEPAAGTTAENAPTQTASTVQSAAVERVLSWHDGVDRARAYLVRWQGMLVAVSDEFATTNFAPGDQITFSTVQETDASGKHLDFMMFVFPHMELPVAPSAVTQ